MSDIVERLRDLGFPDAIAAADEIERLQLANKALWKNILGNGVAAEIEHLRDAKRRARTIAAERSRENAELRAENERLRRRRHADGKRGISG